jgi:hypothetical protein
MSTPAQQPKKGVPVERVLVVLGVMLVLGLIFLGTRGMFSQITLTTIPVTGEWQSKDKPWHLTFRPDKTLVSSAGSSQESGTYSVNYFGTLWVKLNSGKLYTAELSSAQPNRFDLIDTSTEVPTVFERTQPITPESVTGSAGRSGT